MGNPIGEKAGDLLDIKKDAPTSGATGGVAQKAGLAARESFLGSFLRSPFSEPPLFEGMYD